MLYYVLEPRTVRYQYIFEDREDFWEESKLKLNLKELVAFRWGNREEDSSQT